MAMELFVFSNEELNSTTDWQSAINAEGFPLLLDAGKSIKSLKGFLPARLRDIKTGFECNFWSAGEIMREMPSVVFGHEWKRVLALRWGSNLYQVPAVWMAAVAYASATEGVVFDEEQGVIRSVADARLIVEQIECQLPQMEALVRQLTNDH